MNLIKWGLLAIICVLITTDSQAQISEIKVGVTEFDERTTGVNWSVGFANENSIGINADIIFEELASLKWALSPQPYVGGLLNLEGNTSYIGGGLLWRQTLGEKFYTDLSIGAVIHNGTTNIEFEGGFQELINRLDNEIEFGSRVLFKPQISMGFRVNKSWAGEVFFEHLSHGGLLGDRRNDGVDNIGAKVAKRF